VSLVEKSKHSFHNLEYSELVQFAIFFTLYNDKYILLAY